MLLTPGIYNAAYFEHSFLAQQMGIELVEGSDLVVHDGYVWMRTTKGFERVDVIYRRIDDDFLDPETFRSDSMLGVPRVDGGVPGRETWLWPTRPGPGWRTTRWSTPTCRGSSSITWGRMPVIPNVPTYICSEEQDLAFVLEHMDELVVKAANESGGYGMLVGPHATRENIR